MFNLSNATVALVHKNERIEKHGEENRLACDLEFELETDNGVLAHFAPALRSCLYDNDDPTQGSLVKDDDRPVHLRFPAMGKIKWEAGALTGAELRFHVGISGKSDVMFEAADVDKFRLECKEGGTVVVYFRAQVHPTEQQSGKLSHLLQMRTCTISITPPGEE